LPHLPMGPSWEGLVHALVARRIARTFKLAAQLVCRAASPTKRKTNYSFTGAFHRLSLVLSTMSRLRKM
jgi:hypothetical protein